MLFLNCYYCLEGESREGEYIYYTEMNLAERTFKYSTKSEKSHHFSNEADAVIVRDILDEIGGIKLEVVIHREN